MMRKMTPSLLIIWEMAPWITPSVLSLCGVERSSDARVPMMKPWRVSSFMSEEKMEIGRLGEEGRVKGEQ